MTPGSAVALFVTMFAVAIIPGPSDFAVVARSITCGFRHGLLLVLGVLLADFMFIAAGLYGMTALASYQHAVFVAVQYACAFYLLWLGLLALSTRHPVLQANARFSGLSSFASGFMITLADPKAVLFYMALFPAFIDMQRVSIIDGLLVMLMATAIICGIKLSYASLAQAARRWFENSAMLRILYIAAGCMLIVAGVFVLLRG